MERKVVKKGNWDNNKNFLITIFSFNFFFQQKIACYKSVSIITSTRQWKLKTTWVSEFFLMVERFFLSPIPYHVFSHSLSNCSTLVDTQLPDFALLLLECKKVTVKKYCVLVKVLASNWKQNLIYFLFLHENNVEKKHKQKSEEIVATDIYKLHTFSKVITKQQWHCCDSKQ